MMQEFDVEASHKSSPFHNPHAVNPEFQPMFPSIVQVCTCPRN